MIALVTKTFTCQDLFRMFPKVDDSPDFPRLEEEVLAFWKAEQIYERSLEQRAGAEPFVFYEGPPTANGLPHPGHCLTRAIKDLFPRFRTMRGYRCERKAGWDTHGLPVETEVCKELGIHSKEEIEQHGVEPFVHLCQKSVWRYMQQWEKLTERLGFWLHLDEAYVTYHQSYVESVWWSLKQLFDNNLLYKGLKIVWWWAQGGTALSAGEVGEGYRMVDDPSVYVRFPLVDEENTSLLVWTTTPWTLPSNQFAAVRNDLEYALVTVGDTTERLYLAADLVEAIAKKAKVELTVVGAVQGDALVGKRYVPPFDYYYRDQADAQGTLKQGGKQHLQWRVTHADFVTTESGTGLVHEAPPFGEDDYKLLQADQQRFVDGEGPGVLCAVGPDGKFTSDAPDFEGQWVKDADRAIIRDLKERGVLFHQEQYNHNYPFCWRADDDSLIQYPRESWFIRTTSMKDQLLANNQGINWLPENVKEGRFGKFLESNVDWALSRERYWGTPLPIWVCAETGKMEAVESYAELQAKPGATGFEVFENYKAANPDAVEDLRVHKPYIDAIEYDSPFAPGARMRRVSEVIDCWYDSGAMPFAQWGYPHQGEEKFSGQFPADFISEAQDQTRGWFYSLTAISTLLFGDRGVQEDHREPYPHPFRNCIVLGLMNAEAYVCQNKACGERNLNSDKCPKCGGKAPLRREKMSKRLRNYREPQKIFDTYGADALRWYFLANQPPWSSIIYSERAIRESMAGFRSTLWNVFKFVINYAIPDGFDPGERLAETDADLTQLDSAALSHGKGCRPVAERAELDRWMLSELNLTIREATAKLEAYDNYNAASLLSNFLDAFSNWWVRRSRDRFWQRNDSDNADIADIADSADNADNAVRGAMSQEKLDAYWTAYECLLTFCKLIAPFVPFLSESLWRTLAAPLGERALSSIHLCDYPVHQEEAIDEALSERMNLARQIVSLGRRARVDANLKVRQPLQGVELVLDDKVLASHRQWLESHESLIAAELNVKSMSFAEDAEQFIEYLVAPNFKQLGPRVGKLMPALKKALSEADGGALRRQLDAKQKAELEVAGETITLGPDDIEVRLNAKPGWATAQGEGCVVVLNAELTDDLIAEGVANDFNRAVQERRKQLALDLSDRIVVAAVSEDAELKQALELHQDRLLADMQADSLSWTALADVESTACEAGGRPFQLYVKVS